MAKVNSLNNDSGTFTVDDHLTVTAGGLTVTAGSTTLTPIQSTAATGVVTVNSSGVLAEVETGAAGTVFVGTSTSPKFLTGGTTGQIFTANTTADPGWTTATYPSTIAKGDVVVGTNTNVVGVVATAGGTSGYVLTAQGSGNVPIWSAPTGGSGFTWSASPDTTTPIAMAANTGYIANYAGTLVYDLPATVAVGAVFKVTGMNTALGWKLQANTGQTIYFGTQSTTSGGYLASTAIRDSVEIVCIVANTTYNVISGCGNITVA